jgi:hypothetical protein
MEQKMALVHQRLALLDSESDKDADVTPAATSVRPFSLSSSQILPVTAVVFQACHFSLAALFCF